MEQTIAQLRNIYGELTIHWGPEHDYLGMVIKCHPGHKKISLIMQSYLEGTIKEFEANNPGQNLKIVTTPATEKFILNQTMRGNHHVAYT